MECNISIVSFLWHTTVCDLLERGRFRENKSSWYWKGPAGCSPANPISHLISIPPLEPFNAVSLSACLCREPGVDTEVKIDLGGKREGEEREGVMEHLQVALFQESASYFTNKRTPGWLMSPKRHAHWKWQSGVNIHSHPVFTKQVLVWKAVLLLVHLMMFKRQYKSFFVLRYQLVWLSHWLRVFQS